MSGFAVRVRPGGAAADPVLEARLAAAIAWRGPDAQAARRVGGATLLHARLASTDDPPEAQPTTLGDDVWLVADARIDGREALRRRLADAGCPASASSSDDRLILLAYRAWGTGCASRLIGDFAFAIWDAPRRRLFCARDPFGAVPFHYVVEGRGITVANVLAAARATGRGGGLNRQAVGDYLLVGYPLDPAQGFFTGVARLPAAHRLVWEDGALGVDRYWHPPEIDDSPPPEPAAQRIERVAALMAEAVADRMRCGRVDVAMSGGLDSTAVAAWAVHAGTARVHAWTTGFDWLIPDTERHWAATAARHLGIPIDLRSAEPAFLDPARLWRRPPEPQFELRRPPLAHVPEAVEAAGGRVVLTGHGGDFLFAGPVRRWADLAAGGRWRRLAADAVAHYRHFGHRPPQRAAWRARRYGRLAGRVTVPPTVESGFAREHRLAQRAAELTWLQSLDARIHMARHPMVAEMLSALDPAATGARVRFHHPLFDTRLLEEAARTPPAPWLHDKALLRATGEGLLLGPLLRRRKTPLAFSPYLAAARIGPTPGLEDLATEPALAEFVDVAALGQAIASVQTLDFPSYYQRVLLPLSLAAWLRQQRGSGPLDPGMT